MVDNYWECLCKFFFTEELYSCDTEPSSTTKVNLHRSQSHKRIAMFYIQVLGGHLSKTVCHVWEIGWHRPHPKHENSSLSRSNQESLDLETHGKWGLGKLPGRDRLPSRPANYAFQQHHLYISLNMNKLAPNECLHPDWMVFMVLEGSMDTTSEER